MSYRFDVHEGAKNDSLEAYAWYESKKQGLGDRFTEILERKLDQIARNPEAFGEKSKRGYREAALEIFPYIIAYKLYKKNNVIFITSIHHRRKHPRNKFRR